MVEGEGSYQLEGALEVEPAAPERGRRFWQVAGARFARVLLPVPIPLPIVGGLSLAG